MKKIILALSLFMCATVSYADDDVSASDPNSYLWIATPEGCQPPKIAAGAQADSPVPALCNSAAEMITALRAYQKNNNDSALKASIKKSLIPNLDTSALAQKLVSPELWKNSSAAEQKKFIDVMTDLIVRVYRNALQKPENTVENISFKPKLNSSTCGQPGCVKVSSAIHLTEGKTVDVTYSMIPGGSRWLVYDFSIATGIDILKAWRESLHNPATLDAAAKLLEDKLSHKSSNDNSSE